MDIRARMAELDEETSPRVQEARPSRWRIRLRLERSPEDVARMHTILSEASCRDGHALEEPTMARGTTTGRQAPDAARGRCAVALVVSDKLQKTWWSAWTVACRTDLRGRW